MARASASGMPALSPSRTAAPFSAVMRCADLIAATIASGSAGADERRTIRSVESRRSHSERYRRAEFMVMMVPLDDPPAERSAPVLDKGEVEARAPETAETIGPAGARGDPPAGRCRARRRGGA